MSARNTAVFRSAPTILSIRPGACPYTTGPLRARALSSGVFTVAMDASGLPPFVQRTHKGWGTRSCVNTQLENAVAGCRFSTKTYLLTLQKAKFLSHFETPRRISRLSISLTIHQIPHEMTALTCLPAARFIPMLVIWVEAS